MLSLIVACDQNHLIGKDGKMPWHLPRDLKFFRQKTLNQTVIMGYKTYQSLGKALPQRHNLVLSRKKRFLEDAESACSVEEALQLAQSWQREIWIIGGGEIYSLFMPYVQKIYLTRIHHTFTGDTYFHWQENEWTLFSREDYPCDENHAYALSFLEYQRS